MTDYTTYTISELKAVASGPNSEGILRIVALEALRRLAGKEKQEKETA